MAPGLAEEERSLNEMLVEKVVKRIRRRQKEVVIEFTDGTRFFVDFHGGKELELSITDGFSA